MTGLASRIECQPAYVLHTRPYKETSVIASLITLDYGRIDGVVAGVRKAKSRSRALLQPMQPLHVSWRGDNSLKTLSDIESCGVPARLNGRYLNCVLYANELLSRLLLPQAPCPSLFREYALLLLQLEQITQPNQLEPLLRQFEWQLLTSLGYPINFVSAQGHNLQAEQYYQYDWQSGFVLSKQGFLGEHLLRLQEKEWQDAECLKIAKQLSRIAFKPLLGDKPLLARQLFQVHRASKQNSTQPEFTQHKQPCEDLSCSTR
ncbi:DNA replication and repair protein RecO [Oceanospirillum multiglobuliferum]|uniref:DNA repair protein RecO n=1 Tax=Oceanospirillum multiglobuliferum TaxID=64969 RepID=A0A1T4KL37_9GAMM|nr:DNA repair protein RecO [Oceanospirillum multiglobuliferum]OPX56064.1 DNA repair protein RecO [Oceanospirillum multiglobuliferum]SJZ43115.1 DNA replication and repair protein RecO [Oceanospirillum multiglobuliferum]